MHPDALHPFHNLGPRTTAWLEGIGVHTVEQLQELGPFEAYRRIKATRAGACFVLLFALHACLRGCHWNELPEALKAELKEQAKQA